MLCCDWECRRGEIYMKRLNTRNSSCTRWGRREEIRSVRWGLPSPIEKSNSSALLHWGAMTRQSLHKQNELAKEELHIAGRRVRGPDRIFIFFYRIFMCEIKVFILFLLLCSACSCLCLSRRFVGSVCLRIVQLVSFFTSIVVSLSSPRRWSRFTAVFYIVFVLHSPSASSSSATCALYCVRMHFAVLALVVFIFTIASCLAQSRSSFFSYWIDPIGTIPIALYIISPIHFALLLLLPLSPTSKFIYDDFFLCLIPDESTVQSLRGASSWISFRCFHMRGMQGNYSARDENINYCESSKLSLGRLATTHNSSASFFSLSFMTNSISIHTAKVVWNCYYISCGTISLSSLCRCWWWWWWRWWCVLTKAEPETPPTVRRLAATRNENEKWEQ